MREKPQLSEVKGKEKVEKQAESSLLESENVRELSRGGQRRKKGFKDAFYRSTVFDSSEVNAANYR